MSAPVIRVTKAPIPQVAVSRPTGPTIRYNLGQKVVQGSEAALKYQHDQTSPSAEWIVNHNLGFTPSIEVLNTAGREIEGDVLHISLNQTRIYFNQPIAGKALAR